MPDELEERLERAFGATPPSGDDAAGRALTAALAALPPTPAARTHRRRRLLLVPAALVLALVFGGVTLAASGGRLPLVSGSSHHGGHPPPAATARRDPDPLPRGAIAFSAAAGGRVWLATSGGASLRNRSLRVIAASPGAVNAIEAGRGFLRAVRLPHGGTAFSHRLAGTAVAAAWAPAGIRIAYVVRAHGGYRLYDMWGNGANRFLVARHTAATAPSWRWDSQAFAYIRADGRVVVHDVIGGGTAAVSVGCGLRHAAALAFAPYGGQLAVADGSGRVALVETTGGGRPTCLPSTSSGPPAVAWLSPHQLVVGAGTRLTRYAMSGPSTGVDVTGLSGRVEGLVAAPGGRRIALALRDASGRVRVVEARTPRFSEASRPLRVYRVLLDLDLGRAAGPVALAWQ